MKKRITFLLTLIVTVFTFAQEQNDQVNAVIIEEDGTEVPYQIIEQLPVHANCDETSSSRALRDCMSKEMNKLILKNFNTDLANDLGLPAGRARIITTFTINKEGLIDNIRIRAPHPKLKEEALRLLSLIPQFKKPGIQKGKPVRVSFALPIVFVVQDTSPSDFAVERPLTKKEKKALEKEAKRLAKKLKKEQKKAEKAAKKNKN